MSEFICDHCGYTGSGCPYPQENHCEFYRPIEFYLYGMKSRGYSLGCQPTNGLTERRDDNTGKYWDLLVYNRRLCNQELQDYELEFVRKIN